MLPLQTMSTDCFCIKLMDRRAILVLTDGDRQGLGSEGAVKLDMSKCAIAKSSSRRSSLLTCA